jgi:diketogulonate reductase-like aldo/keto reductase
MDDTVFADFINLDGVDGEVRTDSDSDDEAQTTPRSTKQLNDGNEMPLIGLGVYMAGERTYQAVKWALELGYRLVDTASMYENEEAVGKAVRESGVPREELFITTKLNTPDHGFDSAYEACKTSLALLQVGYIDLYLIHSPYGGKLIETFDALLKLKAEGFIKSVGVSNFGVKHLRALRQYGRPAPAVNQFEMHPMIYQERQALLKYCEENKIAITAYGSMFSGKQSALKSPTLQKIAEQHGKSPSQVLLRWGHQHGFALIPKSVSAKARQEENRNIFDFQLSAEEVNVLSGMGGELAEYWNPVDDAAVDLGSVVSLKAREHAVTSGSPKPSRIKPRRVSVCLSIFTNSDPDVALEALKTFVWSGRDLQWHDHLVVPGDYLGCGFEAGDLLGSSFSTCPLDQKLPPTLYLATENADSGKSDADPPRKIVVCTSAQSAEAEQPAEFAEMFLQYFREHCIPSPIAEGSGSGGAKSHASGTEACPILSVQVVVVSPAKRIPLMALPFGLDSLSVPLDEVAVVHTEELLTTAGLLVLPEAVSGEDVVSLHSLVRARVIDMERVLQQQNIEIGQGGFSFAEIIHRGEQRWDISFHQHGKRVASADGSMDPAFDTLERIATTGPWVPTMKMMLGEGYTWEAGAVCSRPGARGQGWHADAMHSAYNFDGETGVGQLFCVFIPLVPLSLPVRNMDGVVEHGLGCTGFWPGSHRYEQCCNLGALAANHLHATIPGAPMQAGSALIYDARVVHCGSPNDAFQMAPEEAQRPILQITYHAEKHSKMNMYGIDQVLYDA